MYADALEGWKLPDCFDILMIMQMTEPVPSFAIVRPVMSFTHSVLALLGCRVRNLSVEIFLKYPEEHKLFADNVMSCLKVVLSNQ